MDKPDVDSIEGLSPAISIDQKTTSRNPRSTVGTVTEIYDYLRLLYARVGRPHCPKCGKPDRGPVGRADRRPRAGAARGHAVHGPAPRSCAAARASSATCRGPARRRLHAGRIDGEQRPARGSADARQAVRHTIRWSSTGWCSSRACGPPERLDRAALRLADGLVEIAEVDGPEPHLLGAVRLPRRAASRCPSWRRASSRSTRRTAPARAAPASARSARSIPSWSCPTPRSRSPRGRWCPGR